MLEVERGHEEERGHKEPRAISSVALKEIAPYGLRGEEALLVSGLRQDKYGAKSFSSQARV